MSTKSKLKAIGRIIGFLVCGYIAMFILAILLQMLISLWKVWLSTFPPD